MITRRKHNAGAKPLAKERQRFCRSVFSDLFDFHIFCPFYLKIFIFRNAHAANAKVKKQIPVISSMVEVSFETVIITRHLTPVISPTRPPSENIHPKTRGTTNKLCTNRFCVIAFRFAIRP